MSARKVAVVTGSNKGIGFACVRALCKQFDGDVYITSRDAGRGQAAVEELKKEGLNPLCHQLDIDDHSSVQALHDFLQEKYAGLDILINNAAIAYTGNSTAPFPEQAEVTMKTNFWSTLDVCDTLFPLLRPHARVVNVSSFVSQMTLTKLSPEVKKRVLDMKTMDQLKEFIKEFVQLAKEGTNEAKGWGTTAYGMSKVGVTVMSMIQQVELDAQGKEDIVVNGACPGFVATDMTAGFSHLPGRITPDEGAENPVYAALLPANIKEPRGKFLKKKEVGEWA